MPDVSFAIVTFNNERTIGKCIESIVRHVDSRLTYTIYIIDNASKDGTLDIVRNIAEKMDMSPSSDSKGSSTSNITIIENESNIGFGAGHNIALKFLSSPFHIVVNPDIIIENNCIYEMKEFMDTHSNIGLLSPMIKYPDGRLQYLCKRNPTFMDLFIRLAFSRFFTKRQYHFEMRDTGYSKEFNIEYATGCFMFFRTALLKQLSGFDERIFLYLEDADITRRMNQISASVFYPYNYVIHEWQRGSHKSLKLMWINVQSATHYFRKWGFKLW